MNLFYRLRVFFLTRKHSSKWNEKDKRKIIDLIEANNKKLEVVREEVFEGPGQAYRYYFDDGKIRCEGYYYSLGYDKKGRVQDEKFQGKNIEYYSNGQIKEIDFYLDGVPTGEYYSYDSNGNLLFSQSAGS
jgi:antitoxin component YwqK of YwqJK toxin-antitoxin module